MDDRTLEVVCLELICLIIKEYTIRLKIVSINLPCRKPKRVFKCFIYLVCCFDKLQDMSNSACQQGIGHINTDILITLNKQVQKDDNGMTHFDLHNDYQCHGLYQKEN